MSQAQAKAARRKQRNGLAHLGNSLKRPKISGLNKARAIAQSRKLKSK